MRTGVFVIFTAAASVLLPGCYTQIRSVERPAVAAPVPEYYPPQPMEECYEVEDEWGEPAQRCFDIYDDEDWYRYHHYPERYSYYYYHRYGTCPPYLFFDAGCGCCRRAAPLEPVPPNYRYGRAGAARQPAHNRSSRINRVPPPGAASPAPSQGTEAKKEATQQPLPPAESEDRSGRSEEAPQSGGGESSGSSGGGDHRSRGER